MQDAIDTVTIEPLNPNPNSAYFREISEEVNGNLNSFLPKVVGQVSLKRQLQFRLRGHLRGLDRGRGGLQPLLLQGPRGWGKSDIVRGVGKRLSSATKEAPKPFIEINCASLTSIGKFIDATSQFLAGPESGAGAECTIFLDEIHTACTQFRSWFLSLVSPNADNRARVNFGGQEFELDYSLVTIICATTNPQALSDPLKSRLNVIALDSYSKSDMEKIINLKLDAFASKDGGHRPSVTESAMENLVNVSRQTPRFSVRLAKDLYDYCQIEDVKSFDAKHWRGFATQFNIKPFGLNMSEWRILQTLNQNGALTLTGLAARLSMDRTAIQRDSEIVLLENGLVTIGEEGRSITAAGRQALAGF